MIEKEEGDDQWIELLTKAVGVAFGDAEKTIRMLARGFKVDPYLQSDIGKQILRQQHIHRLRLIWLIWWDMLERNGEDPTSRLMLHLEVDLIEDINRIFGFDAPRMELQAIIDEFGDDE